MRSKRHIWILFKYADRQEINRYDSMTEAYLADVPGALRTSYLHGNNALVRRVQRLLAADPALTLPMEVE